MGLRSREVDAVEIMDGPDCDPDRLDRTYGYFRVVNAVVSGWRGVYRREIRPRLSADRPSTLLDIGSGGGDMARALARWAAHDRLQLTVTAIDPDARAHRYATGLPPLPGLTFRQALSSELAEAGLRFDFVVSNHVLHHLTGAQLGGLLADCERLAAPHGRVLLGDIERSRFAYLGFGLGTWPVFRDSYIRHDGLLSIRRSFTAAELAAAVPPGWSVTREQPSRLVLRWTAPGAVTGGTPGPVSRATPGASPDPVSGVSPGAVPSAGPESKAGRRMRDVVVVGGGPVGVLLAGLLAVRGLDVEVVERRAQPSLRSRAIGIHPPSMRALEELGLADAVTGRAVRIRGGTVRCDGSTLGRLVFTETAARHPFVVSLPQYETEALLRARFEELSPGRYRAGVGVTGVRDRGDRVEVETSAGVVEARYVVAADGAHGALRALAGIRGVPRGGNDTYLMSDYPDGDADPDANSDAGPGPGRGADADSGAGPAGEAVLFFERGGVVESFPLPGGRRRWVAMTDGLRPDASSLDLAALVRARTGVVLPPSGAPVSAFAVQQCLADRFVSGRVVLVGDAAHQISPIGGQGMNLGWLDALQLAPALARALADPPAAASVLADYDRRRRRSARMAARQAGFNMAMGRPAEGLRLTARNALVRTLAVPPASALLSRAFTMRWL